MRFYFSQAANAPNSSIIAGINALIQHQSIALGDLMNRNSILNQRLDSLSLMINQNPLNQVNIAEEQFNIEGIFRWISSGRNFNMILTLVSEFPQIIYKEKGFHMHLQVRYANGEIAILPSTYSFEIALFTMENPPKLLKTNISGRKFSRGTYETVPDANGNIHFQNIVINEVSSHYPNDSFCLVILCPSLSYIKPLATSGISVRARKHKR